MKEYFELQYRIIHRKLKDVGLEPLLAYIVLPFMFVGFSIYLFLRTDFAEPVYLIIAMTIVSKLSEIKRNDFLRLCFGDDKLKKIRITENLIVAFPFLLFLTCKHLFISTLLLVILSVMMALANFRTTFDYTIPTPFSKKPFEFATGFRNTFYLIFTAYALTIIAVSVDNFNLGIFAMLFVFAISMNYYTKNESEYYVWIHSLDAKGFLLEKIKTSLLYSSLLVLPIAVILAVFYPQNINALLLFFGLGWCFLIFMIVSKYAAYPDDLNITQGILFAFCISFPPLLVLFIPYLFRKSVNRLHHLLP